MELTHANMATNLIQCDPVKGISLVRPYSPDIGQEKQLGILPFFHMYGLTTAIHMSNFIGGHVMCLRKFDVNMFLQAVRKHKVG